MDFDIQPGQFFDAGKQAESVAMLFIQGVCVYILLMDIQLVDAFSERISSYNPAQCY